ncbi:hypothetical protein SQ03_26655 [Methylobacterium platani JCM 14648]|uniref:DUF2726 domain-containing protein n=1 Tax=Methylobacterium platani JCM 14648 TaxID=1295136 RepID=A0ABR5GR53_9HYPH|nr:hypothetical protein SQ03_26655 [Methylobacterium platani JCM 14648]
MPGLLAAGLLLLGLAALAIVLRGRAAARIERKPFLTRAEIDVLDLLRRALPAHHVSCQVSMGALLTPRRGLSRKEFWRTRNLFGQKIVDYVAIDPATGEVAAVIELDDASHDARKDRARDALLAAGQYRVIRIPSKPRPSEASVREATEALRGPARRSGRPA